MSAALHLTEAGPVERLAHRLGLALLRWSEARAARSTVTRAVAPPGERESARLAFQQRTDLEARHRHWDELASATPRLR